jgi:hypothetical protein
MRFSSTLTSIREPLNQRQEELLAYYRGRTTNATPTELFIDAQPSRRIVPSADSSVLIKLTGIAHYSNGTTLTTYSQHVFRVSTTGVITQIGAPGVELAGAVAAPSGAVAPKVQVLTLGGANGYTFTIVPATTTSNAYIALTVTGLAATTIDWEMQMVMLEAGSRG